MPKPAPTYWLFTFVCRSCGGGRNVRLEEPPSRDLEAEKARLAERIAQAKAEHGLGPELVCVFVDLWVADDWHCWHEDELKEVA
jgi:phenylpyruvate tautomerase PptA (4-oxalocrotonate tautomerase family)